MLRFHQLRVLKDCWRGALSPITDVLLTAGSSEALERCSGVASSSEAYSLVSQPSRRVESTSSHPSLPRTLHSAHGQLQHLQQHPSSTRQSSSASYHTSQASAAEAVSRPPQLPSSPCQTVNLQKDLNMEELLKVLLQPMPLGKVRNKSLNDKVVQVDKNYFLDPAQTLQSMVRALNVIKQVLKQDGHILIANSNHALKPLMKEAERCCINPNVWFYYADWAAGTLTDAKKAKALFQAGTAARKLFALRGVPLQNVHCPQPPIMDKPKPSLDRLDKLRLMHKARGRHAQSFPCKLLYKGVVDLETQSARLPLPNSASGPVSKIALVVALDLTHNCEAVQEAHARNIMTVSLVNSHSDLSSITYPVYAAEFHTQFQHFFLEWILRVVNLPGRSDS